MSKMKRANIIWGIMLIAIIVASFGTSVFAEKKLTFAFFVPTMDNPAFYTYKRAADFEAERQGVKMVAFDGKNDQLLQLSQVEDAIQQKVDCLIINPVDTTSILPAVEQAARAGIPVISWDRLIASDKVVCAVTSDPFHMGYIQGEYIAKKLNGKGNVVMLSGPAGVSIALDRAAGYKAALEKHKGIKILAERFSPANPAEGVKHMEDFLSAFSKIDALFCFTDSFVMGAVQAIQNSGRKDILVTSFDLSTDGEKALREGKITGLAADEIYGLTEWPVIIGKKLLEGRTIPTRVVVGGTLVTKDNIDKLDLSKYRQMKMGD